MFKWELINDHTGERQVLETDPHGWEEISFEHNRSERYDSIFLDFSRELSFHCKGGGKEMLDEIYEQYGSEGLATLNIYFKCDGNFKLLHETEVHFPSYREELKGKTLHTIVEVRKKSITQTVLSRDDTDVDLLSQTSIGGVALNPYDFAPYTLNSHSKTIRLVSKYLDKKADAADACTGIPIGPRLVNFVNQPGLNLVAADLDKTNDVQDFWLDASTFTGITPNIDTVGQPFEYPITVTVDWDFSGRWRMELTQQSDPLDICGGTPETVQVDMQSVLSLKLVKTAVPPSSTTAFNNAFLAGWTLATIPQRNYLTDNITEDFSGSGGITLTINSPEEKIYLLWVYAISFSSAVEVGIKQYFIYDTASITFTSDTNSPATDFNVIAIHEAWSRVCEGITDQTLAFKSEFFGRKNSQGISYNQNGYGSFTAITDGLRIRGFEQSDNAILTDGQTKKGVITTLKDLYDACNGVWGIGLGVETHDGQEVVRVEEKDYFYQDVEIFKLSNIPNIEMRFAEEMAYSEVQLGYEKWKIESKGGLDEPNTIARWIFPKIKNIKNVKELTSPYVAGMYAIEATRRESLIFNTTGDSDYDDELFFIALNRQTTFTGMPVFLNIAEKTENITVDPNTLLAPHTAYNLRFNLFSNFDRTMNQFTNGLTKNPPQSINYSYLQGNGQMEFQYRDGYPGDLNGLESTNVQDTEIPNGRHRRQYPIFIPEIYTFSMPLPYNDYLTLLTNPYGYISFSESDRVYKKGYIKALNYEIAKQMAEFTLIRKYE